MCVEALGALKKRDYTAFSELREQLSEHGVLVCRYDPVEGDRYGQLKGLESEREHKRAKLKRRLDALEQEESTLKFEVAMEKDSIKGLQKQLVEYTQQAEELAQRAGLAYEKLVAERDALNTQLDEEDEVEEEMLQEAKYRCMEEEQQQYEIQCRLAAVVPVIKPAKAPAPVITDKVLKLAGIVSREVAEDTVYWYQNYIALSNQKKLGGAQFLRYKVLELLGLCGCDLVWAHSLLHYDRAKVAKVESTFESTGGNMDDDQEEGLALLGEAQKRVITRMDADAADAACKH
jgi:hypothetical protein